MYSLHVFVVFVVGLLVRHVCVCACICMHVHGAELKVSIHFKLGGQE